MAFEDSGYAERCLGRIGYYRLSAYWYPFREFCVLPSTGGSVRCDRFMEGTTFDQVLDFYLFDKQLRLQLADALERIEIGMRATLIEVLGVHGSHAHRDERSYNSWFTTPDKVSGERQMTKFLDGQDSAFDKSKEEFSKHFRRNYAGKPPIWVAAGAWEWGNVAYMISGLSDRNKTAFCAEIDPRLRHNALESWMTSLNEVRNACAHHSRLWNKVLTNSPSFQKKGDLVEFDHMRLPTGRIPDRQSKRLYGALVVTSFLMKRFHPKTEWQVRLAKFIRTKKLLRQVDTESAGFPEDWHKQGIWRSST